MSTANHSFSKTGRNHWVLACLPLALYSPHVSVLLSHLSSHIQVLLPDSICLSWEALSQFREEAVLNSNLRQTNSDLCSTQRSHGSLFPQMSNQFTGLHILSHI